MLSLMKMMCSPPMTLPLFLVMHWLRGRGTRSSRTPLIMPTLMKQTSINQKLKLKELMHHLVLNQPTLSLVGCKEGCRGRETGAELHYLTGEMNDIHNTYPWRVIGTFLFLLIN